MSPTQSSGTTHNRRPLYTNTGVHVELLEHTPEPERIIAAAARLCYSAADVREIMKLQTAEDRTRLIEVLRDNQHFSAFEHASFTFGVSAFSRISSQQLTRHRVASFSQQSQRYVNSEGFAWRVPPWIEESTEARAVYEDAMRHAMDAYRKLVEIGDAMGGERESVYEDSRFVLPNAVETKLVFTMNARELLHFFDLRCCLRAQWEIRELAMKMLALVKPLAPAVFDKSGPSCVRAKCSEGRMSCGRIGEVRGHPAFSRAGEGDSANVAGRDVSSG